LDAVHLFRDSVVTHALKRSAANDRPAYAELKHKLIDLDHQDSIEEESGALTKANMTSSTTINEVCTDNITSYNPVITTKSQTSKEKIVMNLMEKIKSQRRRKLKLLVMRLNQKMTTHMFA